MQTADFNPLVSIIIPVYNGGNYLAEAIDSALAQTYKNLEIIVVNDGSCDNGKTEEIALSYGDKIRYFRKENGGSSSALNYGIKQMNGEWFSWLSHDDLYYPEKIEKQVNYIKEYSLYKDENINKNIFFTASENVDENGKCIRKPDPRYIQSIYNDVNSITDNKYLIADPIKYCFHGCGCLIHKSAFDDVGFFDENLRLVNDIDMWYRLYAGEYILHYIPEILVKGRVHSKQISRSIGFSYHNPEQDMFWKRNLEWLKSNCDLNKDYNVFYEFGKTAYEKTRYAEGKKAFEIAGNIEPKKRMKLFYKKCFFRFKSAIWTLLKKMYLLIKV